MTRPQLALDFDGPVHAYSAGWQQGAIYDQPTEGVQRALSILTQRYKVRILTARYNLDDVQRWLERQNLAQYLNGVPTNEKFGAVAYIDDRGVRWESWDQTLRDINRYVQPVAFR